MCVIQVRQRCNPSVEPEHQESRARSREPRWQLGYLAPVSQRQQKQIDQVKERGGGYQPLVCQAVHHYCHVTMSNLKAVVHFQNEHFSPPCHPRCSCLSFFSRKESTFFEEKTLHIVDFNGLKVQIAASKCFIRSQTRNKSLI